ncbi:hypothetical protein ACTWP5_30585 [Streptomyces sp. 4N509B]
MPCGIRFNVVVTPPVGDCLTDTYHLRDALGAVGQALARPWHREVGR